jgi:hypothetical protein
VITVAEKYALEVGSPTQITSERQHEEYLSVLDKLARKAHPSSEEEKYAEVLMTSGGRGNPRSKRPYSPVVTVANPELRPRGSHD